MFDYDGPMLWTTSLFHDATVQPEQILAAVDTVIEGLRSKPVDQSLVDRSITKMRSYLYDTLTQFGGFGRADLMACYALFDDDPSRIDSLETEFRKVTPQLVERTARDYLRKTNRTVLLIDPGADAPDEEPQ
jgi:predicted Zn-dependent peptidase